MITNSPKTYWSDQEVQPIISDKAYVFESAAVIGAVVISDGVLVSPGASIRGDEGMPIFVGEDSNVQDAAVLHGLMGQTKPMEGKEYAIYIGPRVSCGHCAVIHGPCCIKGDTFVGFNAVVIDSVVEPNVYIGHGAQVVGVHIPEGRYVEHGAAVTTQAQADTLPLVPEELRHFNEQVVAKNAELARKYPFNGPVPDALYSK